MFFNRFQALCAERGISVYKACTEIGLNRSAVAKWKNGGSPNGTTAAKLAEYFGVTTDYLLCRDTENVPADGGKHAVSDEDIKFALFGGDGEITDAMYDEVKRFAAFIKKREADKKE
ncbi:MAG: helix-turn-helix transcriptional regulator [Oscillospiraceae bacterium]|nr:helix-turn-helix transcriptional regulator [Oscillospiraceae bacterium]MBQ8835752.1 helix-turn-helix transcriptional regulator [Oscillospiraceae bacterium]